MQNLNYSEHINFHELRQVDILISKNQALQILYLKHHVYIISKLSWIRNYRNPQKFDSHEMNKHTLHYKLLQHNKTQAYLTTGQPS